MKIKGLLLGVSLILVLSACGEEENKQSSSNTENIETVTQDLSNYPMGVQIDNVSAEYHTLLMENLEKFGEFNKEVKLIYEGKTLLSDSDKESLKTLYKGYIVYVNGINYSPQNTIEQEIDEYFSSTLYHQESWANYKLEYYTTGESVHRELSTDEFNSAKLDWEVLIEVMNKYELFVD